MCGRMNIHDAEGIQAFLDDIGLSVVGEDAAATLATPRYNIAPSAMLPMVTRSGPNEARLQCIAAQWGIVPSWAQAAAYTRPLINARAETVFEKRSFKKLIRSQRAVVPVNGFYEWQRAVKPSQAWHFRAADAPYIAIAAIWQSAATGEPQVCLLTHEANALMAPIHHRMPVLLPAESVKTWLLDDTDTQVRALLKPPAEAALNADKVADYVNAAHHDDRRCIEPLG